MQNSISRLTRGRWHVRVLEKAIHFGERPQLWALGKSGEARISGLSPHIADTLTVQNTGILTVDSASPLVVNALISSNQLTINTTFKSMDRAIQGWAFMAQGAFWQWSRYICRNTQSKCGESLRVALNLLTATFETNSSIDLPGIQLVILPGGTFDLGGADELRWSYFNSKQ
jgi:hypothetical protein